jgi:hypothetical protein
MVDKAKTDPFYTLAPESVTPPTPVIALERKGAAQTATPAPALAVAAAGAQRLNVAVSDMQTAAVIGPGSAGGGPVEGSVYVNWDESSMESTEAPGRSLAVVPGALS